MDADNFGKEASNKKITVEQWRSDTFTPVKIAEQPTIYAKVAL
jgi:hypothetical protein